MTKEETAKTYTCIRCGKEVKTCWVMAGEDGKPINVCHKCDAKRMSATN